MRRQEIVKWVPWVPSEILRGRESVKWVPRVPSEMYYTVLYALGVCVCSIKWVPRVPSVLITLFVSVCVGVKRVPRVPSVLEGAGER